MKRYINIFIALIVGFGLMSACESDIEKPMIDLTGESTVSPELDNSLTGAGDLSFENETGSFEVFEWTPADYGQQLAVVYSVEVAASSAFETVVSLTDTEALSAAPTVKEVNNAALLLGIVPFEQGELFFRVVSKINGIETTESYSAVISRTVTPYVTDFPSVYMIGAALKGWDTSLAVEVYGTGPSAFEVIAEFHNGEAFRFFEAEDWGATSYNYTYFEGGAIDANFENANDGDTNIRFIGTTGFYRIGMNLNTKTITMEALSGQPKLYMVGSAVPDAGWGWNSPVEMEWVQDGVFKATTTLESGSDKAFRFFTEFENWGSGLNHPHYVASEYEIDGQLADAMDGDNNFTFTGTTGIYSITVNDIAKTIVISEAGTAGPPKYLVGAGVPAAGWGWDSPVELVQVQAGVFSATTEFAVEAFRVFAAKGDWGSGTNYPGYADNGYTIDANFENANDGDKNFKFIGTAGTYKFTLNENTKTITLE